MKKVKTITLLLLLIFVNTTFAQLKRANKYYDNYEYIKAIQLYKKAIKKKDNKDALEKIANCYRLTKQYKQAELSYADLIKLPGIAAINSFYYGTVLKNNGKIEVQQKQIQLLLDKSQTTEKK